jgi:Cu+-exporting ATPase
MEAKIYDVEGMSCVNCANTITKSLQKLKDVNDIQVDFLSKKASLVTNLDDSKIIDTIKSAGYSAKIHSDENVEIVSKSKYFKIIFGSILSIPYIITMFINPIGNIKLALVIVATFIQIYFGASFYKGMFSALKQKTSNMDTLIAIGTTTAYIYSLVTFISDPEMGGMYFETSVLLLVIVTIGKFLEERTTSKTNNVIKGLLNLKPSIVHIKDKNGIRDIATNDVKVGDILLVKPGESIPTDGYIISGQTWIDESMITGESVPVDKQKNSKVIGGTINGNSSFEMFAEKVSGQTVLAKITKTVEDANRNKPQIEKLADKISSIFVPCVLLIGLLSFSIWFFIVGASFGKSIIFFVATIVIACPCALGLATPTAVMVGTGIATKTGILIKGGIVLEKIAKLKEVFFDKTGTLTNGKPVVSDFESISQKHKKNDILSLAASLESESEHSLAKAILDKNNSQIKKVKNYKTIPGFGIEGIIDNKKYYFGKLNSNKSLSKKDDYINTIESAENDGKTVSYLYETGEIIGFIIIEDKVRDSAKSTVSALKNMGFKINLLTGDSQKTANNIGKQVGVDNVISEVLPNEKANYITGNNTAMVGDGINDAPALAKANVGIAMGMGSDIAKEQGDAIIINNDIEKIVDVVNISKKTVGTIKQNLFFSLFYNCLGIPIAAGAFASFGLSLRPEFAGIAMALSDFCVIGNSLLLNKKAKI